MYLCPHETSMSVSGANIQHLNLHIDHFPENADNLDVDESTKHAARPTYAHGHHVASHSSSLFGTELSIDNNNDNKNARFSTFELDIDKLNQDVDDIDMSEDKQISREVSLSRRNSISQINNSKVKHQIKTFAIHLSKNDTLGIKLENCINKMICTHISNRYKCNISVSNRLIIIVCLIAICLFAVAQVGNSFGVFGDGVTTLWYYLTFLAIILHSCLVLMFLSKLNCYIFKQGLQSFLVWYKSLHVLIAMISLIIGSNWYQSDYHDIKMRDRIIRESLNAFNYSASVFCVAIADGLPTKSTSKTGNKIKQIGTAAVCLLCLRLWMSLYFEHETLIVKSLKIELINKPHYLTWSSIAMSGIYKTMVFCAVQLWINFKRPTKNNVIALPVAIEIVANVDISDIDDTNTSTNIITHGRIEENLITHEFTIKVPKYRTLLFIILQKWVQLNDEDAFKCSKFWLDNSIGILKFVYSVLTSCIAAHCILYLEVTNDPTVIITFYVIVIVTMLLLSLNLNYTLVYYKRNSLIIKWKLYQIVTFTVSMYCLRYKHGLRQFDPTMGGNLAERIAVSILCVLWGMILTWGFSMHFAYFVHKSWKIIGLSLYIVVIMYYIIYHYSNDSIDWVFVIFGHNVSLRAIVISSGFDLCLWTARQVYHVCLNSDKIHLVSKVEVCWKE